MTSRCITVHFVSGAKLRLLGAHVPKFMDNYKRAVTSGYHTFYSEGEGSVLVSIDKVTFIQEHELESDDQYKCQSYYDDNELRDGTYGKCEVKV